MVLVAAKKLIKYGYSNFKGVLMFLSEKIGNIGVVGEIVAVETK